MPELIRLILVAMATAAVSYWFGRRAKVDDIRIRKVHELVQEISVAFQDVDATIGQLRRFYESNFNLLPSVSEAMQAFRQHAIGLYADQAAAIDKLGDAKRQLTELLKQARVYLPVELCADVDSYLEACRFGWSNVWPLFDTYLEGLFDNLLSSEAHSRREQLRPKILKALKQAAS